MTDLYETLSVIKTSIVNSIGEALILGNTTAPNYVKILTTVADEVNINFDFMCGLEELDIGELEDLGFQFLSDDSDLMLFPLWLYPFIPDSTELRNISGVVTIKGMDDIIIHAENWIDVGIIVD